MGSIEAVKCCNGQTIFALCRMHVTNVHIFVCQLLLVSSVAYSLISVLCVCVHFMRLILVHFDHFKNGADYSSANDICCGSLTFLLAVAISTSAPNTVLLNVLSRIHAFPQT